ncbi:MAG: TetR/AcrR family transcriptional regulator [Litorimonas sp.]
MARTQAQDFDDKRVAIMKQAAGLFASKGFSGASVSDISKACGVSKSLIYHYFGAKEDILYQVMTEHIDDLVAIISDPELIDLDATQEFHNLTLALLECYAGAQNAQKVLLYDLNKLTPQQRKTIVKKQRDIIDRFEHVYIRINPDIATNRALLRTKIMLFFGSVNWIHNWYDPQGEINRHTLSALAVANIISSQPLE